MREDGANACMRAAFAYNARMSDMQSSNDSVSETDLLLPGPPVFLAAGFDSAQLGKLGAYLFALFQKPPDLRELTPAHWGSSVAQCLGISGVGAPAQVPLPQTPESLPRMLLVAGRRVSELFRVVEFWAASGLPRPIFAAATENNLHFAIAQLVAHLEEEHRLMTQGPPSDEDTSKP